MKQPHYHHRTECRLCDGRDLTTVLKLKPTPPANAFVSQASLATTQETFPLDPDYLLILARNFAEPIMVKCADFMKRGGRFIVPLPEVRVI